MPPPSGNVSAPLNVSTTTQYKGGALGVGGLLRGYSDAIFDGNVGIGTTSPGAKLDVQGGDIKIGSSVTIKGDGSESTGLNSAKVGGYTAADLLAAGGGGCYVSYSGSCLTGFTNMGSAGSWGYCFGSSGSFHFRPPGGGCDDGWIKSYIGEAFVCCQ